MWDNWTFFDLHILFGDWQQVICLVVFGTQFLWLVYSLLALCRETKFGSLVDRPALMPISLFFCFLPGLAALVGWMFLFDLHVYTVYACLVSMGATGFLAATTALSLHASKTYDDDVKELGLMRDVWAVRLVVQNCLALVTTWAAVLTCYSLAVVLFGYKLVDKDVSQYVALGILMLFELLWCGVDLFVTQYLTHFLFSPYLMFTLTFVQPFFRFYGQQNTFFVLSTLFLGFSGLIILVKLVLLCGRCCSSRCRTPYIEESEFCAIEYVPSSEECSTTGSGSGVPYSNLDGHHHNLTSPIITQWINATESIGRAKGMELDDRHYKTF